jgi:hypothetical protein
MTAEAEQKIAKLIARENRIPFCPITLPKPSLEGNGG